MCAPVASSVSDTELRCIVPPLLAGTYPVWFRHKLNIEFLIKNMDLEVVKIK